MSCMNKGISKGKHADLRNRGKAVGGTRGIGDDEVFLGVIAGLVHTHDKHGGGILGRRGDHNRLGSAINVRLTLHKPEGSVSC